MVSWPGQLIPDSTSHVPTRGHATKGLLRIPLRTVTIGVLGWPNLQLFSLFAYCSLMQTVSSDPRLGVSETVCCEPALSHTHKNIFCPIDSEGTN